MAVWSVCQGTGRGTLPCLSLPICGIRWSDCVELWRWSVVAKRLEQRPARTRGGAVGVLVSSGDPFPFSVGRFEFLQPWHQYNAYYEFKKQFFLQKEGGDSAQVPREGRGGIALRPRACEGVWVSPLCSAVVHVSVCCPTSRNLL